ncbi:MAG TPA: NADH-quinone oxidoreductase subunit A, partial [Candidatus Kapabacteria bacterium]|nr:NADH-quinone oxidoreductase subunit A [Candidatus Kapabacteria bacterium]
MISNYIPLFLMVAAAIGFAIVTLKAKEILGPKHPTKEKLSTYESGMQPVRTARDRVSVKYYMVAMLFILFDIEVVFLYPWAVEYKELGWFGFSEMAMFMVILFVGYIYIYKKGAL